MAEQPSEETVSKLLADLQSMNSNRCLTAARTIAERMIVDPRLVTALRALDTKGNNEKVRRYALAALYALEHCELPADDLWLLKSAKPPITTRQKYVDLIIGFVGWYVVNTSVWFWLLEGSRLSDGTGLAIAANLFILPPNMIALIILAFVRRWVALGVLAALGFNFLISIVVGLFVNAMCFVPFFV